MKASEQRMALSQEIIKAIVAKKLSASGVRILSMECESAKDGGRDFFVTVRSAGNIEMVRISGHVSL